MQHYFLLSCGSVYAEKQHSKLATKFCYLTLGVPLFLGFTVYNIFVTVAMFPLFLHKVFPCCSLPFVLWHTCSIKHLDKIVIHTLLLFRPCLHRC